ncbi:hypothetical protein [Ulvibacterium sp.]|uniref:hypothetical protein n=1 Tax=Ulvibacterium sp. TaxID=2665914 RepID=UPI003BA9314A
MKHAPSFEETLMGSLRSRISIEKWNDAKEAYEENYYKDTILSIIDYVGRDLRKKYGNDTNSYFKIPHGSIVVEIEITDTELHIEAPFLEIGEKHRIPLLRKIAEVNFYPLNLSQIKLKGNRLNFHYSTPLHLCEPYKIYYVLEEICHNADNLDDELISLFGAKPLHGPRITFYDKELMDKAWQKFTSLLSEAEAFIHYFDEKRIEYFNWDVINITLKRIEYCIAPNGKLRSDIKHQVNCLYNKEDMKSRIQRGKKFLETLRSMPKEDFVVDMYVSETFIPKKSRSEIESIKRSLEKPFESAGKEIRNKQYTAATLTLLVAFYDLFYYNTIEDAIHNKVVRTLRNADKKAWEESANLLYEGMENIIKNKTMAQNITSTTKSFLSRLFK